jgi:hypothetical protein
VTDATHLRGPAGVLAVILLEFALGSMAVMLVAPVWGVVKRGYFLLVGWSVAVCGLLAWLSALGPLRAVGHDPWITRQMLFGVFVGGTLATVALQARRTGLARALGAVTVLVGLLGVIGLARLRGGGATTVGGIAAMVCGAAFLGATWDGMVLGHWYLVDRKLKVDPMRWHSWAFTVGIALALVSAALAKGGRPTGSEASLNPLLLVSDLTLYLAFGLVAVCALLSFFVHKLVNEGSIRAATGMLYLAVIMAMSAEFAAKARFFTV